MTTNSTSKPSATPTTKSSTTRTISASTAVPQYDYQAKLRRITHEIETNLKSKFEAAIAQLRTMVETMEKTFDQKLTEHFARITTTQANKTIQDNHTNELILITKQFSYLIEQLSQLLGKLILPMPFNGVGTS